MKNLNYLFWIGLFSFSIVACLKLDPIPPKPVLKISDGPSLIDIDSNQYNTVVINTQTWTTSNLKVTKYRNGDVIPEVQDSISWKTLTTGAWCYYKNKISNDSIYGKLYNWHAINDPRGIAPTGYHIPSDAEWKVMSNYLGDQSVVGIKMKATSGWGPVGFSEGNGSNSSKFFGLPGGTRKETAKFDYLGYFGYWWTSSTTSFVDSAWSKQLSFDDDLCRSWVDSKQRGFSLRCIKD